MSRLRPVTVSGVVCAVVAATFAGPGRFEFEPRIDIEIDIPPQIVTIADVNGDDVADLVVASTSDLRVIPGDGFGGFGTPFPITSSTGSASRVLAFHADDDAHLDLVVANGWLLLFFNEGDGTFTERRLAPLNASFVGPAVVDLDGDGRLDIVAPSAPATHVELHTFLAVGDRRFTSSGPVMLSPAPGLTPPYVVETGDFDGDGHADVVAVPIQARDPSLTAYALFGNGDGTFTQDGVAPLLQGDHPRLVAGDLNEDGRTDLTDGRNIHLGRADRTFELVSDVTTSLTNWIGFVTDIDGDTHLDLVTTLATYCGDGNGGFGPAVEMPDFGFGYYLRGAGEATGDGLVDLFAAVPGEAKLRLVPQKGLAPPTVLGGITELTEAGRQVLRLTGSGFRTGTDVVPLGDLIVHGVTVESGEVLLVDVDVPPRIGVADQLLMVRNADARSDQVDVSVRGLHVRNARGKLVDSAAPGRDKATLRCEIEFTDLSARGPFVDVRDGLRLELGDPDDPLVIDLPVGGPNWRMKGATVPARFIYKSAKGEFPRLKVIADTVRGRLELVAKDLDLPGAPAEEVLLRVRLGGEPADDRQIFRVRTRAGGVKRVLRRK